MALENTDEMEQAALVMVKTFPKIRIPSLVLFRSAPRGLSRAGEARDTRPTGVRPTGPPLTPSHLNRRRVPRAKWPHVAHRTRDVHRKTRTEGPGQKRKTRPYKETWCQGLTISSARVQVRAPAGEPGLAHQHHCSRAHRGLCLLLMHHGREIWAVLLTSINSRSGHLYSATISWHFNLFISFWDMHILNMQRAVAMPSGNANVACPFGQHTFVNERVPVQQLWIWFHEVITRRGLTHSHLWSD